MIYEDSCAQTEPCDAINPRLEHILIVDDDFTQAAALAHHLQKQGYYTSIATTGREGRSLARAEHPDLIVLDIRLPDSDGLTICWELSDNVETCEIPVIIVTAMERPDIIRQARAAGCQYYVRKPYDPNALLILVENAISESRSW